MSQLKIVRIDIELGSLDILSIIVPQSVIFFISPFSIILHIYLNYLIFSTIVSF